MTFDLTTIIVSSISGGGLYKIIDLVQRKNKSNYINPKTDALAFRRGLLKEIEALRKKEEKNENKILELVEANALMKGRFEALTRENAELVSLLHKRLDTMSI
jgi:hypothetical protein